MENFNQKRRSFRVGLNKSRGGLNDISSRVLNGREDEVTSRSKFDFSDSEYFESGIVSRAQSPSDRSLFVYNNESDDRLSSVPKTDNFSEVSLESVYSFTMDKAITNTSSFNQEGESTFLPSKNHTGTNKAELLPVIGLVATTVYCWSCRSFVHSRVGYLHNTLSNRILQVLIDVLPCCHLPDWSGQGVVHKCPRCFTILAKGINE